MDKNLIIQYSVVGIIILCALIWIGVKAYRRKRNKGGGCCGCSLADSCGDKSRRKKKC